jgi:molybdopterin/thiamine biosynthesis adenylyltransferase
MENASNELPHKQIIEPNYFLRQERTKFWNQQIIKEQIALILGVGGVGTTCAMNCVRMGFKKVLTEIKLNFTNVTCRYS